MFRPDFRVCDLALDGKPHQLPCWLTAYSQIQYLGLWPLVQLLSVCMGQDAGPYEDSRWYQQGVESVREYLHLTNPEDPIFAQYFTAIARERGLDDRLTDPTLPAELHRDLIVSFERKFGRVATCRRFQVFHRLGTFLPWWRSRLPIYVYMCLSMGMDLKIDAEGILRRKLAKPEDSAADDRTRVDKQDIRDLKRTCANGLHFCAQVLMDTQLHQIMRGVSHIMRPLVKAHNFNSTTLRSFASSLKWYVDQASGASLRPVMELVGVARCCTTAQACGLWFSGTLGGVAPRLLDKEHPLVARENGIAKSLGGLASMLMKHLLRDAAWHLESWPGAFAALLDASTHGATLARMKLDWQIWQHVQGLDTPFWRAYRRRSCMQMRVVQKVFVLSASNDFESVTPVVAREVEAMFSSFGQSNIIELGVNVSRRAEEKSYTKRMANNRRWETLIDSQVMEGWFDFKSLDGWASAVVPRGLQGTTFPDFFSSPQSQASMTFNTIVSDKASTPWHSPKPTGIVQFASDLAIARRCNAEDCWTLPTKTWLGCLLPDATCMVRRKAVGITPAGPWSWCLGEPGISSKIAWPVDAITIKNNSYYTFGPRGDLKDIDWNFVFSFDDLEVLRVEWVSWGAICVDLGKALPQERPWVARGIGDVASLLVAAAQAAFYTLQKTALKQVAREAHIELEKDATLFEMLYKMVQDTLKCPDGEVLRILETRLDAGAHDHLHKWVTSECFDLLSKEDQIAVKKEESQGNQSSTKKEEAAQFLDAWRKKRSDVVAAASNLRKTSQAIIAVANLVGKKRHPKAAPVNWEEVTASADAMDSLLPPHFRMYKDTYNHAWELVSSRYHVRRCRAWHSHGVHNAAQLLIAHAWAMVCDRIGEPCPIAGIEPKRLDA